MKTLDELYAENRCVSMNDKINFLIAFLGYDQFAVSKGEATPERHLKSLERIYNIEYSPEPPPNVLNPLNPLGSPIKSGGLAPSPRYDPAYPSFKGYYDKKEVVAAQKEYCECEDGHCLSYEFRFFRDPKSGYRFAIDKNFLRNRTSLNDSITSPFDPNVKLEL